MSHSQWRKNRNIRRAQARWITAQEKRGRKQAIKIMQEQASATSPADRIEGPKEK